ncbi:MAG: putative methyltransferase [Ilumatobacteraceae bacterium]|nr:putative methyltransferase [Ilumatobacteraceae bacterium]
MGHAAEPSDFYTGLVAQLYAHLRSQTFDPEPYARFIARSGEPALELGCGDGDPILELRSRGVLVEGLDSSIDMLDRCRQAADERGLDVVLHHGTIESMDLGRTYRSIYLAGATFNLLADDATASAALQRIAAHLEPGGSALIPLFIPDGGELQPGGAPRQHQTEQGSMMRLTVVSVQRDQAARTQTSVLRYELIDGDDVQMVERAWVLHWFDQEQFATMATEAGLTVRAVFADDGSRAADDAMSFTFWLRLDGRQPDASS